MKSGNICKFIDSAASNALSVSCFILESDPEVMRKKYILNQYRAILVVRGEGVFHFNGYQVPFVPGCLVFGFRGETFYVQCDENCEYMYIHFDGVRAEELLRRFCIHPGFRCFPGCDGLIPLWRESLSRASPQTIDLASESMLLYTFSRLSHDDSEKPGLISRAIEITEEHFTDPSLSLSSIAEMLGYNVKYLSHVFKEKMGVGYSDYLRTLRIKYAVSLFDHGIESIKTVALLSGFSDPLYFSSVFKKSVGLTPREYQKKGEVHQ